MSDAVTLPAVFSGIQSKVDRSYKLTFNTREMSGEHAAELLRMNMSECWLIVAPSESALDAAEIPDYKPETGAGQKTPAQRQRSVMFIYWKQQGGTAVLGDFDVWYRSVLERSIDQWKAKLDDGEERT